MSGFSKNKEGLLQKKGFYKTTCKTHTIESASRTAKFIIKIHFNLMEKSTRVAKNSGKEIFIIKSFIP